MMNVKPLGKRVLIKRAKATASKGGILLPDSAQEKPKEGKVLAVGPGKRDEKGQLEPVNVKVGDCVLYSSYAGTEVKNVKTEEEGEEFLIISEDDILGVIHS